MALIKEPYGLVYNDDGSLCTTYRDDDVPFAGVRSFAVETATTNFMPSEKTFVEGTYSNSYPFFAQFFDFATLGINNLEKVTFSLEFYNDSIALANGGSLLVTVYRSPGTSATYVWATPSSPTWVRKEYTFQRDDSILDGSGNPYTGFSIYLYHYPNYTPGYTHIRKLQVEKKPFASSFVNGTRPKGRLVISVEDLKFDIANDDWVISYWKYPVATRDDTQNGYNLCSLGRGITGDTKGYIWWGKENNMNKYRLLVVLSGATYISNTSYNTFNPTDYFYHWHYEVLKKQGKVLSYYVDGVKQCELIIPADKEIQTPFDVGLNLGGYIFENSFFPTNALIAAPYYGYNSATWTDDYIREVYEAKIPFSVQSQLSIY